MNPSSETLTEMFADRRTPGGDPYLTTIERRQFTNSYEELSHDAKALANAIDGYKLRHRRRFINYEEMLDIIKSLGYTR